MLIRIDWRGNVKRAISLLIMAFMVISLFPTTAQGTDSQDSDPVDKLLPTESQGSDRVIVSLGDSYSSGEGIEQFYGQNARTAEKVKNPDWIAHRSKHAWSGMLLLPGVDGPMLQNRDTNWYFVAASGAETRHLFGPQNKDYHKGTYKGNFMLAPQIDIFYELNELRGQKIDYVTITIGGNDAEFGKIVKDVVMGSTYLNLSGLAERLDDVWEKFEKEGGIRDSLIDAYTKIAEAAGPDAHIIVAGYPELLDPSGLTVSKEEANMVNNAVIDFNAEIKKIVEDMDDKINIHFVPVVEAFKGHEAYSDYPYINEVIFGPVLRPEDLHDFGTHSDYSVHPNFDGALAYARCVQAKINELEGVGIVRGYVCEEGTNTLIRNAKLYFYAHSEEEIIKVIDMSEEDLQFTTFLPIGDYSVTVEAEGYINSIISFEVTYEEETSHTFRLEKQELTEQQPAETYPPAEELFDNTCWHMAYGQTLGLNYYGLFQTDGTFRARCVNGLEYPDGTYEYDASTGRMTVYFNNWADEFEYGDGSFISVDKYQMQVGEDYLTISPDPEGMQYFEEEPVEPEPAETEPIETEPVGAYPAELIGGWFSYDTVDGTDCAWGVIFYEDGTGWIEVSAPNGTAYEAYDVNWSVEEDSNGYYLTMRSPDDRWGTFAYMWIENGRIKIERNDGESDVMLSDLWYERDLDYQTWLERKSQFAVEFEGRHEYVLLRNPYLEGNSMDVYLWSNVMDLACWEGEVGSDNLIRVEVTGVVLDEWNYDYYGDGEMILTHWGYDEDGRLFLQGTNLEGDQNMEYLISADGQVTITLSGDGYAYDYQGSFLGIRYVLDTVRVEIASDCRYLDNRSGQSESVSEWELLEYLASESSYNYTHITVTITVRQDGVYITQIEIPYFP